MNKVLLKHIFYLFIAISSVIVLFFIISKADLRDFLQGIELKTFDMRQSMISKDKKTSKDIVIVSIDDATLEVMENKGIEWPVPRKFYADFVNYIEAQKPKSIAFDLTFVKSLKSNVASDTQLAGVFKKYDNVFTAINFDDETLRVPIDLPESMQIKIDNKSKINLKNSYISVSNCRPILPQIIENTSNIGHINLERDADGIIREVPFFVTYKNAFYPHLALKVAMHYLDLKDNSVVIDKWGNLIIADKKIPLTSNATGILNWYGKSGVKKDANTFQYISMGQIIKNMQTNVAMPQLKDKIVYVGTSATSLYDIKSVPTDNIFPGIEIHATLINNIMDDNFIKRTSPHVDILLCFLLAILTGYIVFYINSTFFATLSTILTGGLYFFISTWVMRYMNISISVILPLISIVLVYTTTYIVKYILKSRDFEYTYKLATTDGLTNLYNHRFFQEQMLINIENAKRYNTKFSLILIDIDFFKKFNDTYGHQAGDAVLRQVADQLKKTVRLTDIVCRYGGEEMSIILTNTDADDAFLTAQKICDAIASKPFKLSNTLEKNVTISLGVSTFPQDGQTPTELIEFADKGLYLAKENGRNQARRYTE